MRKNKALKVVLWISSILLTLVCAFFIYASVYYHTNKSEINLESTETFDVELSNKELYFKPKEMEALIVFYPGAKVEYTAYANLGRELAKQNIGFDIIKMPFNFAFFGQNKATKVIDNTKDIPVYISGHSLGGAIAAIYANENSSKIDGLIMLAAYSTKDISNTNLNVLTVYGSNDLVLNHDKLESCKKNLPASSEMVVIEGGTHAGIASYGEQKKDGKLEITNEEQITQTVNVIAEFIKSKNTRE